MGTSTETFFRPAETARERIKLPAGLLNRCLLLLNRTGSRHVFVPVRSMQYQAVIDAAEIIFVDSQRYAVSEGQGGRLIVLAWDISLRGERASLNDPVPIELVCFSSEGHAIHRRLMSEFPRALDSFEERLKDTHDAGATVLPFRQG